MMLTNYSDNLLYQLIKRDIINGRWASGAKLTISDLCAAYAGYSATSVRDALIRLQPAGLVESVSHIGFYVTVINYRKHLEILTVRHLYELQSAVLAADHMTSITLHGLTRTFEAIVLAYYGNSQEALSSAEEDFFKMIHRCHPYFALQDEVFSYWEKSKIAGVFLDAQVKVGEPYLQQMEKLLLAYEENDIHMVKSSILAIQRETFLQLLKFLAATASEPVQTVSPYLNNFLYGTGDSADTVKHTLEEYKQIRMEIL